MNLDKIALVTGLVATGITFVSFPFAASASDLFVTVGAGTISKITDSGVVSTFVSTGLLNQRSLAINSSGDLFVSGNNGFFGSTDIIEKITPSGIITTFGSTGLRNIGGLAFNSNGNLFVTDNVINNFGFPGPGSPTILEITPSGIISTFAPEFTDSLAPGWTNYLGGLAFNSSGDLFVTVGGGTISKITPSGVFSTFASGLTNPIGLAFNSSGDLFVTSDEGFFGSSGTIEKITPSSIISTFASGLTNPRGLAFNSSGDLFVAEYASSTISKITPSGVVSAFASTPYLPFDLAFAPSAAVPEPSTILGLGTIAGLGLIGGLKRKFKSLHADKELEKIS